MYKRCASLHPTPQLTNQVSLSQGKGVGNEIKVQETKRNQEKREPATSKPATATNSNSNSSNASRPATVQEA
eukprot:6331176-Amphidinium_carterae.1